MTRFINPKNPLRKSASAPTKEVPVATPVLNKFASRKDEQNFDNTGAFNPLREGSKTDRVFNANGETNAYDNQDALVQARNVAFNRSASVAEQETQRRAVQAALESGDIEGMRIVGQEMTGLIKARADRSGWARKVYMKKTLKDSQIWRIAKDPTAAAFTLAPGGQAQVTHVRANFITPPEDQIAAFFEISNYDLRHFDFDVIARMQELARQAIELEEDKLGLTLLNTAAVAKNTVSTFSTTSIAVLEALRYQVEKNQLIVDKYLLNRQEMSDLVTMQSPAVEAVTQRELLLAGYMGRALGASILCSSGVSGSNEEVVPVGTMYAVTAPEYLGEMGIRQELKAEPYNQLSNGRLEKGFSFSEMVGFGIPNPKVAAKAIKL